MDKIRPILKITTNKIDTAKRMPKEDPDEEELFKEVKPLVQEGAALLSEVNGGVRGMDPDGRI